ncbi:hypothetical protein [Dolichospermum phage Dfl-JY45]
MSRYYEAENARDPVFWASLKDDAAVDACARLDPENALDFAACRLSQARLDWCALRAPAHALNKAAGSISPSVFDELVDIAPEAVVRYAAGRVTRPQAEKIAAAHPALGIQLSAQLSRETLAWVAGRRPGDALLSDACCCALGGAAVDDLARRAWNMPGVPPQTLEAVFARAPHVVTDQVLIAFLNGESRQGSRFGGPSSRYRVALQPSIIPRLPATYLAEAAEYCPTQLLWMGIEHLPDAVRERALELEHPDVRVEFGASVSSARWAQIERLPPLLRAVLTGETAPASAPAL